MSNKESTAIKMLKGFQYATDNLKQVVIIRTVFLDDTTSDTPIPRGNIKATVEYLERALSGFDSQDPDIFANSPR